MIINKTYNKSVTSLEPGEIVEERYNGSNAKFAILTIYPTETYNTITFSKKFNFRYIDWDDGTISVFEDFETVDKISHTFDILNKNYNIVIMGLDTFGLEEVSNSKVFNFLSSNIISISGGTLANIVRKIYFGEGVKMFKTSKQNKWGLARLGNLKEILNVSECPAEGFEMCRDLETISFNIDLIDILTGSRFFNCPKLKNIFIPSENTLYKIEDNSLYSKDGKKLIKFPSGQGGSTKIFKILDGTESLDTYSFDNGSLKGLIIPNSVTTMQNSSIDSSFEIEKIYIEGASFGLINKLPSSTPIYYYSETEPTKVGNYWRYVNGEPTIWGET